MSFIYISALHGSKIKQQSYKTNSIFHLILRTISKSAEFSCSDPSDPSSSVNTVPGCLSASSSGGPIQQFLHQLRSMLLCSASALKNKLERCRRIKTEESEDPRIAKLEETSKTQIKLKGEPNSNGGKEKQERKQSVSTNEGRSDSGEESAKDYDLNCLDITFSNCTNTRSSEVRPSKRFSHHSPQVVLLYSLLYNHFHIVTLRDQLPAIAAIDEKLITSLKVVLRDWTHTSGLNQTRPIFCPKALLSLLLTEDATTQEKQSLLKSMMSQMDSDSAYVMLSTLISYQKSGKPKQNSRCILKSTLQLSSAVSELQLLERQLNDFGWVFGISLKLYRSSGKRRLGAMNSCICIGIKLQDDGVYSLKNIACFQEEN